MIFGLLVAFIGAAQETFVVFEGAESNYYVTNNAGSNYSWDVFIDFNPETKPNSDEYVFTTPNGLNQIGVRWNKSGLYYLDVMETDASGCVNRKVILVNVISLGQSIAFETSSSSACFNFGNNGINLNLELTDNEGNKLDELKFPVETEFEINGRLVLFQIGYNNQNVFLPDSLFNTNSLVDTQFEIRITNAYDVNGKELTPLSGHDTHIYTVHGLPEIDFVSSDNVVYQFTNGFYQIALNRGKNENALYHWWIEPSDGTSTDISSIDQPEANILWDGPVGFYNLNVSTTDGNGCYSDTISRSIEILESDTIPFKVFAGSDTVIGSCDFYLFADVYPVDESYTYSWEPSIYLDDPNVPNPLFIPGDTTTYVLTVTTPTGESAKDTITVSVEKIEADAGDDVFMEFGSTVILDGTRSIGTNLIYSWSSVTGTIEDGENTPNPIVSDYGTYYLEVFQKSSCISIDSVVVIRLAHAPIAYDDYDSTNFMTEINIPVLDNDFDAENSIDSSSLMITLSPLNGIATVDFNDYTIRYQANKGFNGTDYFEYQICNNYNKCANANVYVLVTDFDFLIPEAFSPNGDGINDYFEILGIEYFENNSITIINRWGNKVYEAKNYGLNSDPIFWDGKSNTGYRIGNEELPTGTYFYVLNLGNGEKPISGSIYLDR